MGDVGIVYQVRGVGRIVVTDNGCELADYTIATRRKDGWHLTAGGKGLGATERCRVLDKLREHDRDQGTTASIVDGIRPGAFVRGGGR